MLEITVHNVSGGQSGNDCFLLALLAVVDHDVVIRAFECQTQDVDEHIRACVGNLFRTNDTTEWVQTAIGMREENGMDDDAFRDVLEVPDQVLPCFRAGTTGDIQECLATHYENESIPVWQLIVDIITARLRQLDHHLVVVFVTDLNDPVHVLRNIRTAFTSQLNLLRDGNPEHKFHVLIFHDDHYRFVSMRYDNDHGAVEFLPDFINSMLQEPEANIQVVIQEGLAGVQR